MTMKSLLIATLTFSALALPVMAGTKSYGFTLGSPATVGSTELKPGEYKVKLDGAQAVIHDEQTGKSVTVPVKVEHNGAKYEQTTVQSNTKDGKDRIFEIHLGGSDTKLQLD
jgi:hypothetical protein